MKNTKLYKSFLFVLILFLTFGFVGCKNNGKKEQEVDFTDLSVRDCYCENGVVAAANPYAAKAGLDILKKGGNAFDAACAVAFALGVVEPNASGVGGGGIMVAYDASTGDYCSYNFREFVPATGEASAFTNKEADLDYGARSIGVPTEVAGLLTVIEERGKLTRQEIMAPAIDYAKNGFIVTPELGSTISDMFYVIMDSREENEDIFTSDGIMPLKAGETLVQPNLAKTLQKINDGGKEAFYTGDIAQAIVNTVQSQGGFITMEDMKYAMDNYPKKNAPLHGTYHGYDIVSANTPSSGGIILIEALNMLECYGNVKDLGHNSTEYIHTVATALQLAYGDKRKYIGDSEFVDVPIQGLMNKEYAAERWQKYNSTSAYLGRWKAGGSSADDYGNPWPYNITSVSFDYANCDADEHYSTTSFSVADKDGNIVSVTQTINHFFGSGLVAEGTGIFLNNQLSSFSFTSSSAAYVMPYKQPVSHIMPTIIMKDGNPFATLGSPGSLRIPSAVLQVCLNIMDFDMSMQDAIAAPRFYSYACGSDDLSQTSKDIYIENALASHENDLKALNYNVIKQGSGDIDLFFGGVHGIRFYYENGKITLNGGADPRRDGKALGY